MSDACVLCGNPNPKWTGFCQQCLDDAEVRMRLDDELEAKTCASTMLAMNDPADE